MAEIIKNFDEKVPSLKFIGKKYGSSNNGYATQWQEWFKNNWFTQIEDLEWHNENNTGYVGLMKWKEEDRANYEYWIGVFTEKDIIVPFGFDSMITPQSKVNTFYIKGIDDFSLYEKEGDCFRILMNNKYELFKDEEGYSYCFERYNCPRFTNPDEKNEVILDYGFFVK